MNNLPTSWCTWLSPHSCMGTLWFVPMDPNSVPTVSVCNMGVHKSYWKCELWTTCVPVHTYIRVWSCGEQLLITMEMIMRIYLELRMHTYTWYLLHYTSRWSMRWWRGYHSDVHFVQLIFAECYIGDRMCRRELFVIGFLLILVFTTEVLHKVVHHTCVLYPPQTTDQHSPCGVSQATSLSASPPSPTPSKIAAASTRGAPCTSQWSTLCPLRQQSASPPVGAVWSTPSSTWWGVCATSPLPPHSLATKGETLLSWETQSCKVSDCNWCEGGRASKLDWVAFTSPRHNTFMSNGHM